MDFIIMPVLIVAGIGILAGIILTLAARFMAVPVDETFAKVREALPGVNCGACGYNGCDEYAQVLADGTEEKTNLCTPGADATALEVSKILGLDFEDVIEMHALVHCSGTCERTNYVMDYEGPHTCEACNAMYQGRGSCSHACLGFGDCVDVCQYDAIKIEDGIAVIDPELCTGCGMCAKRCPNHLIQLVPQTSKVYVGCSSTDTGAFVRKVCVMGCIGCKKCERTCEYDAIHIENNLARIDPDKCVNCGACIGVCPTKVIHATVASLAEGEAV